MPGHEGAQKEAGRPATACYTRAQFCGNPARNRRGVSIDVTFSANPARTSFRERMRRQPGHQRALNAMLLTAFVLMLVGAVLAVVLVRVVVHEQATQLGGALAADAAERAAEYLVHNDLVSLNVITNSLSRQKSVVGVVVYDRHRQPLAQSGMAQPTPDTLIVSADILTEDEELRGTVEILLQPQLPLAALARFDYALFGWLAFAVVFLLVVRRIQLGVLDESLAESATLISIPDTPTDAEPDTGNNELATTSHAQDSPLAHLPDGAILRIDIVNYATHEQRLSPRSLADLLAIYEETLTRACAFYQGEIVRPLNHQCLVSFPAAGASADDVLFRAICCAQLFFGVVREINTTRRTLAKTTMHFSAALHHDPLLNRDDDAIVTWEICTQAGTTGRLTVTDAIGDHPELGERLVIDSSHRHVLQIELPAADGESEPRLQDVLALGVLRLADPYEELISRQIKRLTEPAVA